jgi:hypothetical protein
VNWLDDYGRLRPDMRLIVELLLVGGGVMWWGVQILALLTALPGWLRSVLLGS